MQSYSNELSKLVVVKPTCKLVYIIIIAMEKDRSLV